jgi:hypothetical protein
VYWITVIMMILVSLLLCMCDNLGTGSGNMRLPDGYCWCNEDCLMSQDPGLAPEVEFLPGTSIDFGNVSVNSTKVSQLTIRNAGVCPFALFSVREGEGEYDESWNAFSLSSATDQPITLNAGEEYVINAIFHPAKSGAANTVITVTRGWIHQSCCCIVSVGCHEILVAGQGN